MKPIQNSRIPAVMALLLAVACGSDAGRGSGPEPTGVRDSAGVLIIENGTLPAGPAMAWSGGRPLLTLTGEEGGDHAFEQVAGIVALADHIAIADAGAARVRVYSMEGGPVASAGSAGDGPGEFRAIDAIGVLRADTLWVYDFGLRRFTLLVFDSAGLRPLNETVQLRDALSAVSAAGSLDDGSFVVREHWSATLGSEPGLQRAPVAVARVDRSGAVADTITLLPGREVLVSSENGRRTMQTPPWTRAAAVAVHGNLVYSGDQDRPEIRIHDAGANPLRIVRFDVDHAKSAAEWADSLAREIMAGTPETERSGRASWLAQLPRPGTRPAHGRILTAPDGELWVAPWARVDEPEPRWWRFDLNGSFRDTIELPAGFRLMHIDTLHLFGVARDALDVQQVHVYLRPRAPS